MLEDEEFRALSARLAAGDPDAPRELVDQYGTYLLRVIRSRLHRKLRPKFDSLDFAQDVWASFFAGVPGRFTFETPGHLLAFLEVVARNKVAEAVRDRMMRQKYNVNCEERSLDDSRAAPSAEPVARSPTPSTVAMSHEEWDRLLARQPLVYQHILLSRREGKTIEQIAGDLGLSERQVRRVVTQFLPGMAS
jgi:RNA polymerase sigma factor (sigma-70 family)